MLYFRRTHVQRVGRRERKPPKEPKSGTAGASPGRRAGRSVLPTVPTCKSTLQGSHRRGAQWKNCERGAGGIYINVETNTFFFFLLEIVKV